MRQHTHLDPDPHWKKMDPEADLGYFAYFYAKTFIISLFSILQIWGLRVKFLCCILPLGSGSVDPHDFADPDPGSQNLADPDPKH